MKILIFTFTILLVVSCERNDVLPSYVHIDSFALETNDDQGSNSHKITDVWAYSNDQLLGVYELPADIPISDKGNVSIDLLAGVKVDGISSTKNIYPFYENYSETVLLEDLTNIDITPSVTYKSTSIFEVDHTFEQLIGFDADTNTSLVLTSDDAEVFEGNQSLRALARNDNPIMNIYLNSAIDLDLENLREAYIEFDYKFDATVTFYMTLFENGNANIIDIVNISPKDEWNKIYIEVGTEMKSLFADGYTFGFYFNGGENLTEEYYFFWDNFKVIYSQL